MKYLNLLHLVLVEVLSENSLLEKISNVFQTGVANGNVLKWNSSTARWEAGAETRQ